MKSDLVGRKIVGVRNMTEVELKREGWDHMDVIVLELDDGTLLYPSRDEEGNGPGKLFGYNHGAVSYSG